MQDFLFERTIIGAKAPPCRILVKAGRHPICKPEDSNGLTGSGTIKVS